jgi:hypothetical protein
MNNAKYLKWKHEHVTILTMNEDENGLALLQIYVKRSDEKFNIEKKVEMILKFVCSKMKVFVI